ncbi:aminotransferase class IV [Agrococcus sp. 1P02AA]|uniref:aminotransferase class IV n=1 Tax=Agrococcus sp. 1P02AA TaxID=3132259 RepID=UPI0039A4C415
MSGTEAARDRSRPAPGDPASVAGTSSLVWTPTGFSPAAGSDAEGDAGSRVASATTTLAADSWLVVDGRVLALQRHQRRFADAVAGAGGDPRAALTAAEAAMRHVPTRGRWSPRLDLTPDGIFLRIRPAPDASTRIDVVTASRDPRTLPHRKGPDLEALAALQAKEAARIGAPVEPIITVDGVVAEGTWSALLWWRGEVLCMPAAGVPSLPSVTAAVLLAMASERGIEVRRERATPAALADCEVWLANALRGIRAVSRWIDGPDLAPPALAEPWQRRLDALRVPPSPSDTSGDDGQRRGAARVGAR